MEAQGVQADVQVEEETSAATETGAGAAAERIAPMEVRDADRPGPAQRGETAPEAVVARTQARAAMAPEVLEDADEALKAGEDAEPSVLGVPGLPVLATEFAAPGSPGSGVRVLQELPSGDTLQVYRLPAGTPPAALPPAEPGIVQWEEARDAGWVVLRARLDATELQRLAGRVR